MSETGTADAVAERLMRHMAMMEARLLVLRDVVAAVLGLSASAYSEEQRRQIFAMVDGLARTRIDAHREPADSGGHAGYGAALADDMQRDLDLILAQAQSTLG